MPSTLGSAEVTTVQTSVDPAGEELEFLEAHALVIEHTCTSQLYILQGSKFGPCGAYSYEGVYCIVLFAL